MNIQASEDSGDIKLLVRHNGIHKYSVPLTVFIYFNLEFLRMENQGQGCYEGNVRSEFRFSDVLLLI
jgi:hypothetical protein